MITKEEFVAKHRALRVQQTAVATEMQQLRKEYIHANRQLFGGETVTVTKGSSIPWTALVTEEVRVYDDGNLVYEASFPHLKYSYPMSFFFEEAVVIKQAV